jgi:hypothetical protein
MSVSFNHTIVYARDSEASATFLAEILGLPSPKKWGPFQVVTTRLSHALTVVAVRSHEWLLCVAFTIKG